MIFGVGTDIVQIPRIEKIMQRYGDAFPKKILSIIELSKLNSLPLNKHNSFLAKRFAAKEAISKAFGIGLTKRNLHFQDITILNDELGKPYARINSLKFVESNNFEINLSISDDYPIAMAFAIISHRK
jgi:holo-[acyl-carrier protein] synthase